MQRAWLCVTVASSSHPAYGGCTCSQGAGDDVPPSQIWRLPAKASSRRERERAISENNGSLGRVSMHTIGFNGVGCILTYLLDREMRMLGLELLMHSIPEDDPAIHGTRSSLCSHCDGGKLGALDTGIRRRENTTDIVLGHRDKCVSEIANVDQGKGDRRSQLLAQVALEVPKKQVTEELLNVTLKNDVLISALPPVDASIEGALEFDNCNIGSFCKVRLVDSREAEVSISRHRLKLILWMRLTEEFEN